MKLCTESHVEFRPMVLRMSARPQLRYCPVVQDDTDAIPFPRSENRLAWQPRLRHDAEDALEEVNRHLNRLADLLEVDDDRPRAA